MKGDADRVLGRKKNGEGSQREKGGDRARIMELVLANIVVIRPPSLKTDNISFSVYSCTPRGIRHYSFGAFPCI